MPKWVVRLREVLGRLGAELRAWAEAHRPQLARGAVLVAVLVYLGSGLYRVGPGEVGVVRRFGRKVGAGSLPGLHYRAPWPVSRVTRVPVGRVQRVEVGFRTTDPAAGKRPLRARLLSLVRRRPAAPPASGPSPAVAATEWNTTHPDRRQEEAVVLTGDENLVEVTLTVQYAVSDPAAYLFNVSAPAAVVRVVAESALRELAGETAVDDLLTARRAEIEQRLAVSIQRHLDQLPAGIRVQTVCLQDVHPPMEVVGAYRDVASAMEEKGKLVNQAEAYRLQEVPLARGQAVRNVRGAEGYTIDRTNRSAGDAMKFSQTVAARRLGPEVTDTRLYLETVEQVLPGPRKFIVDKRKSGRRQMLLIDGKGTLLNLDTVAPTTTAPAEPEIPVEH